MWRRKSFFYYGKTWNGNKNPFENVSFLKFSREFFCYSLQQWLTVSSPISWWWYSELLKTQKLFLHHKNIRNDFIYFLGKWNVKVTPKSHIQKKTKNVTKCQRVIRLVSTKVRDKHCRRLSKWQNFFHLQIANKISHLQMDLFGI